MEGGSKDSFGHGTTLIDHERHIKHVTCKAGEDLCSSMNIIATHDVLYPEYYVKVQFIHPGEVSLWCPHCPDSGGQFDFSVHFTMNYINAEFTKWQIGWKLTFVVVTLLVMFLPLSGRFEICAGYFWQLRKTRRENWTDLQVWVAVLLGMLFLFNDPLFIVEIYSDYGAMMSAVYILFLCAFLATMMFFWLCTLHETSLVGTREDSKPIVKGAGFYLGKAIFCAAFWILLTSSYIYVRVESEGDPSYDALEDSTHYKLVSGILTVVMAVYFGWITYHGLNAIGNVKKLPAPVIFTFSFTIFTIFLTMICVGIGATYPLPSAPYEFLLFYGLTNVYVWVLAFAYAPANSGSISLTEEGAVVEIGPLSEAV